MNLDVRSGLSKLAFSCVIFAGISSSAIAQNNHQYPLDVELLNSAPVIDNLRQRATVEHMIINVGYSGRGLDPQPEMICPTAKSPTIQEWSSRATKISTNHPVISQYRQIKEQAAWHQTSDASIKSKPVPIASAYPFYTGSNSYTTGGKSSGQISRRQKAPI